METILVLRAVGNGWYQLLELDPAAPAIVAAWPATEDFDSPDTPRTAGRKVHRPSQLEGDAGKAYRKAYKAWDGRAFNFDRPAVAVPPGARLDLRQASHLGGNRKPWVAKILGADATYRFTRSFVAAHDTEHGGTWTFYLPDGLYEVCNRNSKGDERRWFVKVEGGASEEIGREVLDAAFPELPKPEYGEGSSEPVVECLECGATYPRHQAHLVDAGGMGCARCNH